MNRFGLLLLVVLASSLVVVNGQFFVDIEHSLPRLGKRLESNENMAQIAHKLTNALKVEILKSIKDMSNEEARDYFTKVIQVMRILAKKD